MPQQGPEAQFRFLIACIRYSNNGKVDFEQVATECEIISKGAAAKRYERMMKANGINHTPPSIRDAPTASRPRKKKITPDPPLAPTSRKRKLAKSEIVRTKSLKEKREDSTTKTERGCSTKSDPDHPNTVSGSPANYPWYDGTPFQPNYESQTGDGNASFNEYIANGDFNHLNNSQQEIQSSSGDHQQVSSKDGSSCVNSYDANPSKTSATKYPCLEIKDENAYVSPYDVNPAEDAATKYPYLSIKSENSFVSPYEVMNTNTIQPAHTSAFSLEHCTSGYTEADGFSGATQLQDESTRVDKDTGSILIAD